VPTKRVRRSPEDARALILDAAERVFGRELPDAVGLKEVAREAGVSHALITHYFGTYESLVEATLERRFVRLRERLFEEVVAAIGHDADVPEILESYRRAIGSAAADATTVRLATWAVMSGRANASGFFSHRIQGLKLLADTLERRPNPPVREDIEFAIVVSFAMAIVGQIGHRALGGAFGHRALDKDELESRTATMLDVYLRRKRR
jgi:AcrR family transcriptional regulator